MQPRLSMEAPGATLEQVRRGVEVAEAVFAAHYTTAEEVAEALAAREVDEHMGAFVPPELFEAGGHPPKPITTARQMEIADIWFEADQAAVRACYAGTEAPQQAQLVLLQETEPPIH